jgi:hypothetical protein
MSITIPGGQEAGFRDADPGDSLEDYYYKWYNGNNVVYQGWGNDGFDQIDNTLRIEGNPLFKKGDSIQVGVIPNDGEDNGSEILSGKVTIENRPPSTVGQPELRLFPEGAIPDKNSYVQVVGDITDPDDATQNLFFVVRWFKNGESISTGASPEESNYLPSSYFDRGDVITADYRPSDGVIEGDRGTASGSILVVNTVPVVSIDKPMDGGRYLLGDTVVFDAAGSYDLDLDALSFKWSINGEEVSTDTSFSYTFNTKGEMVVELEAQDGEGGVITKTITLQLRSPELTILSTEIIITGIQEKGEMITATVKIHNSGNTPVAQLPVTLQTGDGSFVKTKSVDISPGSFETLKFYWQPATDKQYTLSVEANPVIGANRSFVELDYADNTAQLTVTVHKGDTGTDGDDDKIWELWKLLGMTDVQFTVLLFLLLIIIYLVILFSRKNKAMKRFLIDRPVEERKEDEGDGEEEDQDDKEPNSSEEKDKEDSDLLKLAPPVPPLSTLESTDDEKEEDDTEDKGSEPLTKEEKKQQKKEEKQKGKEEKARKKEEEKQRKLEEKKKQKDGGKTDESGEKKEMNEASEGGIDLSELAKL